MKNWVTSPFSENDAPSLSEEETEKYRHVFRRGKKERISTTLKTLKNERPNRNVILAEFCPAKIYKNSNDSTILPGCLFFVEMLGPTDFLTIVDSSERNLTTSWHVTTI